MGGGQPEHAEPPHEGRTNKPPNVRNAWNVIVTKGNQSHRVATAAAQEGKNEKHGHYMWEFHGELPHYCAWASM